MANTRSERSTPAETSLNAVGGGVRDTEDEYDTGKHSHTVPRTLECVTNHS
jgi:hypothetical protein